jgi:hypothetical protein
MSSSSITPANFNLTTIANAATVASTNAEQPLNAELASIAGVSSIGVGDMIKTQYDMADYDTVAQIPSAELEALKQSMMAITRNLNQV